MSTPTHAAVSGDVADYVEAVRAALADLPAAQRAELLDDLADHLREVAEEGDGSLRDRLGPPETYAAELRSSAGLPPRPEPAALPPLARRVRDHPWTLALLRLADELRPAWWLLRAYLLAIAVSALTHPWPRFRLGPELGGNRALGLLLFVALAVPSVALGRRTQTGAARWLVRAGNVALGVYAVVFATWFYTDRAGPELVTPVPIGVTSLDGGEITDIYPYDADGRPLHDVRLYDQNGNPIVLPAPWGAATWYPAGGGSLYPPPLARPPR
jgi:hypothetical protein